MKHEAKPFPFDELLAFTCLKLHWTPAQFWASSPRELAVLLEALAPSLPKDFTTNDFARLLAKFPDE